MRWLVIVAWAAGLVAGCGPRAELDSALAPQVDEVFAQAPLRDLAPPPETPDICLPDAAAALKARLRLDGLWTRDPLAGAMSPRMANANIAAHEERSLREAMPRYRGRTAVLITYAGEGESCSWLVSSEGVVAYGRSGLGLAQVREDVAAVIVALDVTGAQAVRAPSPRTSAVTAPSPSRAAPLERGQLATALANVAETVTPGAVATALRGFESVVVVPHQGLAAFPFMLLTAGRMSGPPTYLVDRLSIQIAPSLSEIGIGPGLHRDLDIDLALMTGEARREVLSRALIVGDPRFNDSDYHMPQLPGAATEARAVARAFRASALVGAGATSAAVRSRLEASPRYLHFATHGLADFEEVRSNRGFIALANGDRLTLEDVRAMRIANGAVVVLSACQTGLGASRPGGVVGLPRAFAIAGAQTVIMSLWNVDDEATGHLMTGFAQQLEATGRPAVAFAAAVRNTRAIHPDPRLWGSFEVFGAGQP